MGEKRRDARGTTLQTTRPLSLGNWVSTTGLLVLMSLSRTVHARIVLCWRSFSWNLLARLLFLAVDIVTHVCTRLVASKLHICLSISSVKGPTFTCYIFLTFTILCGKHLSSSLLVKFAHALSGSKAPTAPLWIPHDWIRLLNTVFKACAFYKSTRKHLKRSCAVTSVPRLWGELDYSWRPDRRRGCHVATAQLDICTINVYVL